VCTTTNSPDAGGIDALDESISVSSTMEPTSKDTFDTKLITKLIETEEGELLKALTNHPQLSPPRKNEHFKPYV
jgi:hypothetical protein